LTLTPRVPGHQLFIAENGRRIVGYAGTGRFRSKAAYDTTAEVTVYCAPDATRRGIGAMLYQRLFESLHNADIRRLVAGITIPNQASIALHRRFRFRDVGVFSENGRKFDRYWDVLWREHPLVLGQ